MESRVSPDLPEHSSPLSVNTDRGIFMASSECGGGDLRLREDSLGEVHESFLSLVA